jgi:DNA-binding transcriptional ArsR family regulator
MTYIKALEALADPTRRKVLERLRKGPRPVGALAEGLPVSRPAVSQHLKVLRGAGLVSERRDGRRHLYRLEPKGLEELRKYLDSYWEEVLRAFKRDADRRRLRSSGDLRPDGRTGPRLGGRASARP